MGSIAGGGKIAEAAGREPRARPGPRPGLPAGARRRINCRNTTHLADAVTQEGALFCALSESTPIATGWLTTGLCSTWAGGRLPRDATGKKRRCQSLLGVGDGVESRGGAPCHRPEGVTVGVTHRPQGRQGPPVRPYRKNSQCAPWRNYPACSRTQRSRRSGNPAEGDLPVTPRSKTLLENQRVPTYRNTIRQNRHKLPSLALCLLYRHKCSKTLNKP